MATLYIAEFSSIASVGSTAPQIVALPPLAEQAVAIGAVTASNPFSGGTRVIRLNADSACSIKVGPAGTTAATTNTRLSPNVPEYFGVAAGNILSVIANS